MATITQNVSNGVYFSGNIIKWRGTGPSQHRGSAPLSQRKTPTPAAPSWAERRPWCGQQFSFGHRHRVVYNSAVTIQAGQSTDPTAGWTISNPVVLSGSTVSDWRQPQSDVHEQCPILAGANVISRPARAPPRSVVSWAGLGSLTINAVANTVPGPIVLSNTNNRYTSGSPGHDGTADRVDRQPLAVWKCASQTPPLTRL